MSPSHQHPPCHPHTSTLHVILTLAPSTSPSHQHPPCHPHTSTLHVTLTPAPSTSPSHQHPPRHPHTSTLHVTLTPAPSMSPSHQHPQCHPHTSTLSPHNKVQQECPPNPLTMLNCIHPPVGQLDDLIQSHKGSLQRQWKNAHRHGGWVYRQKEPIRALPSHSLLPSPPTFLPLLLSSLEEMPVPLKV